MLFEQFDYDRNGTLCEVEFRDCLERNNCQFDDVQLLALFAYFDPNIEGYDIRASVFIVYACTHIRIKAYIYVLLFY
jgi:Ca2+-binding EF-hand superfamily protein